MNSPQVTIVPFTCRLSHLTAFTTAPEPPLPETVLRDDQPFSLRVTVEFEGPGAIAFMPLSPSIQIEFYVKPFSPDPGLSLGNVAISARADLLTYQPTLSVAAPASLGLVVGTIYSVGAVLRVGVPNWPALVHGFTEDLAIEIYSPPEVAETSRRKAGR